MENILSPRKKTKTVYLGGIPIGGGQPISIQSMTNTPTADVQATSVQIAALAAAGCDIVRLAIPDQEAADKLPLLLATAQIPLVADIHFDYRLALASIKAGVQALRLNPGNIGGQAKVREVAAAAKDAGISIRIGVNAGSLEKELLARYGGVSSDAMVESAMRHISMLEEEGFESIKISLKSSDLPMTIAAYRKIAEKTDYPLHIGITEAGTRNKGSIKSAIGLGILLAEGIGDTMRVSLTGDPLAEVRLAKDILRFLGIRQGGFDFVSCPTCARTAIDVEGIALSVEEALEGIEPPYTIKIAVMGCSVNGPGEARDADIGIAGGSLNSSKGSLFCHGEVIGRYDNDILATMLIDKVKELIGGKDQ